MSEPSLISFIAVGYLLANAGLVSWAVYSEIDLTKEVLAEQPLKLIGTIFMLVFLMIPKLICLFIKDIYTYLSSPKFHND